jgi:hypothetical protein
MLTRRTFVGRLSTLPIVGGLFAAGASTPLAAAAGAGSAA